MSVMMRLLAFSVLLGIVHSVKLPHYIVPCVRNSPDFDKCALESGVKAVPFILKGDKNFKVPPLAPLKIPSVSLQTTGNLKITLKDIEINGIETAKLKEIKFDFNKNTFKVSLSTNYLSVIGEYEIDGRIIVPLTGRGPCNITTVNTDIDYVVDFDVVNKDGKDFLKVNKDSLKLKSQHAYYKLDNLFGNQQLSDETNRILNENALEVGKELNGPVTETIRSVVTTLVKNYLTSMPMDEIFLPK